MVDEAPHTRLSKTSQALHEVEPLTDSGIWVVVDALFGSSLTKHVGQKGGMSRFLVGHELDQRHVLGIETGLEEFSFGESGEAVVEEVEFDPFLSHMSVNGME